MIWIFLIAFITVLDQISKYLVLSRILPGQAISVIDGFFYLTHHRNTGAAWSILQGARWFFVIFTLIVCGVLIYLLFKSHNRLLKTSLSFIVGGAIGNLIDRMLVGSVTDFLEFHFGSYVYPIFNIADSFVVIGTILLGYYILFVSKDGWLS